MTVAVETPIPALRAWLRSPDFGRRVVVGLGASSSAKNNCAGRKRVDSGDRQLLKGTVMGEVEGGSDTVAARRGRVWTAEWHGRGVQGSGNGPWSAGTGGRHHCTGADGGGPVRGRREGVGTWATNGE
jgi:hypothetical protein